MGSAITVNVKDENEFNEQMQLYLAQGYKMQSNFNGTAILSKKSYSGGIIILLVVIGLLIFFIGAIIFPLIYYLVAGDDVVTIRNTNGQAHTTSSVSNATKNKIISYCPNCGQGLFEDSKFCPGCGKDVTVED